jgi:fibronectin-binding autotransporter adhesin
LQNGTIVGGTVTASGGAQLLIGTLTGSNPTLDGVTLATAPIYSNSGALQVQNGLALNNVNIDLSGGVPSNFGYLWFQGTAAQTLGGTGSVLFGASTNGEVSNFGAAPVTLGPGILIHGTNGFIGHLGLWASFLNQGTVSADVAGGRWQIASGGFTNAGHLRVAAGATMTVNLPDFSQQPSGVIDVDGLFNSGSNGTTLNLAGGVLLGGGTVNVAKGTGTLSMGGTIAPGHSIGTLTVQGNVTLTSGAHYAVEISGSNSADLLAITGNLDLSTTNDSLDVTALGGTVVGQPYLIATYTGTLAGVFDHVSPFYQVTYAPGAIYVTPTPEPAAAVAACGLAAGLALSRRYRRGRTFQRG